MRIASLALLLAVLAAPARAQTESTDLEPVPEPPELPSRLESGEVMEPDITIIQREEETVVEYRVNGRLHAVKIVPRNKNFPAYYLVDVDGDGQFETRRQGPTEQILINSWVIFSWD